MHMYILSVITVIYKKRMNNLDGVTLFYITVLFLTATLYFAGNLLSLKADLQPFFEIKINTKQLMIFIKLLICFIQDH